MRTATKRAKTDGNVLLSEREFLSNSDPLTSFRHVHFYCVLRTGLCAVRVGTWRPTVICFLPKGHLQWHSVEFFTLKLRSILDWSMECNSKTPGYFGLEGGLHSKSFAVPNALPIGIPFVILPSY